MTRSSAWSEFESGEGLGLRALRILLIVGGVFFLIFTGILELTWPQQIILGLLTIFIAIWMDRSSSSYLVTLTLMFVSMFSTFRYGYWRISTTVKFFLDPGTQWTPLDAFFISLLVLAEGYAFIILFLGYLQTLWPLRRTPVPLPDDPDSWPSVDLLIPTYNEPLSVVRYTALAAMNIDWPADKLNVYILDDGKRPEFRAFAEEAGIGYMTRDDNQHAKAGNINRALARLDSPFVCIFDCDHVPTRSFMQVTLGWFLRDSKLGMLQTPHHFYSPDPFERNLHQFRTIPNEGELFYGIVQDGNDFWNATFFCGSCAVLRRSALDEIGGIAVETVTEDAHTSLRMQMNGWNTAYINIPQAAGLATERLSGHVKQRIRWARGMIQIMRTDNPLFARGLSPAQRLCYFNAMSHFLYAFPRLIFLTAPLIYLVLGHTNVPGYWAAILAYAFPHLILSNMTNSRIQGQHRHSFWNEIYETVLAPYIFLPTMLALVNPKFGSFNVTAKGGVVNKTFFDSRIAQPFMLMLGLNIFGLLMAIPRHFQIPLWPLSLLYDANHLGTIVMNMIWVCFNMVILGVAIAVAWESQQRRQTVRIEMNVPAKIVTRSGTVLHGTTADMSPGGVMVKMDREFYLPPAESVKLIFPVLDGDAELPATIVQADGNTLRAQFDPLTLQQEEQLTMVLYSRADTWLGWGESRETDRPLTSLGRIFQLSIMGLSKTFRSFFKPAHPPPPKGRLATSIVPLLLLALFASTTLVAMAPAQAEAPSGQTQLQTAQASTAAAAPVRDGGVQARDVPPGSFDNIFTLADIGVPDTIVLRGVDAYHSVFFSVPQTQVVRTATMHLRYHFSPGLIPSLSHLKVSSGRRQRRPERQHHPLRKQCHLRSHPHHARRDARPPERAQLRVHRPLHHPVRGPLLLRPLEPRRHHLHHRARRRSPPPPERPQAPPAPVLRRLRQPPSRRPHRLPRAALPQGHAGRRHHRLVVRHPHRLPPGPLSRLLRLHPRRQRHHHQRKLRRTPHQLQHQRQLRPYHRHAAEPLRPLLKTPHPLRRQPRRPRHRRHGPHLPARPPPGRPDAHRQSQSARSPAA